MFQYQSTNKQRHPYSKTHCKTFPVFVDKKIYKRKKVHRYFILYFCHKIESGRLYLSYMYEMDMFILNILFLFVSAKFTLISRYGYVLICQSKTMMYCNSDKSDSDLNGHSSTLSYTQTHQAMDNNSCVVLLCDYTGPA